MAPFLEKQEGVKFGSFGNTTWVVTQLFTSGESAFKGGAKILEGQTLSQYVLHLFLAQFRNPSKAYLH